MQRVLIVWIFVTVLLVGGLTFIGWYNIQQNGMFFKLENKLETAARTYFGMYPDRHPANSLTINSNTLIEEDMLDFENEDLECIGYVIVTSQLIGYRYEAFIRCMKYSTNNFDYNKFRNSDL